MDAFLIIAALYFLPTILALARGKQNPGGVVVLNLFLGWTVLGWVIALAWAFSGANKPVKLFQLRAQDKTTKKCPSCAEEVLIDAKICRYCRYEFKTSTEPRLARNATH